MAEYKDIEPLRRHIADIKEIINSPNSDYMTGYICALSVTEEIIAGLSTSDVVLREEIVEIFDEIFNICSFTHRDNGEVLYAKIDFKKFCELRKKYTGENT